MNIAALFPGQGSQSVGMGSDFYNNSDAAKELFHAADEALGYELSTLCFEGPIEQLTLTQHAQPAILVTSVVAFQLAAVENITAAAGHSLGEYSALVAAGCLDFEQAVQIVHKRGTYMQEAVEPGAGKMVAVMGPTEDEISAVIARVEDGVVEIANLNSPGQTVVAGDNAGIDAFSEQMKEAGGKIIPLQVSAPFHCSLMRPAAEKLAADLDATTFLTPSFPVYANVSAEAVSDGARAKELLKQQVCGSVRWTDSMNAMISEQSIDTAIEFGAGGVLSKLLKRINKAPARYDVGSMDGLAKVREAVSA